MEGKGMYTKHFNPAFMTCSNEANTLALACLNSPSNKPNDFISWLTSNDS
jgi:hypothetical protein